MNEHYYNRKFRYAPIGYACYKAIFDQAGIPCDFEYTEVNAAFEALFGLKSPDIVGRRITEVLPDIIKSEFNRIRECGELALNGEKVEFEQFSDQSKKWYRVHAYSYEKNYFIMVFFDITAQKKTEADLIETKEYFMEIFNTSPNAAIITRLSDGLIIDINDGFTNLSGYARDEATGKTSIGLNLYKNAGERQMIVEKLGKTGYCSEIEATFRRKDGSMFIGLMSARKIKLNGVNHVSSNIRDITDRKHAEEALIVSETRYRRLFEAAKDGILILDAETGMIMHVNPYLIELLGYSKEQFIEKNIWEIGIFKDIVANLDNFLELQKNEYIRYDDLPLETIDGRQVHVEFVSNVYLVDNHKVIQCNIRDITERKRLESELAKEKKLLEITLVSVGDGVISCDNEGHVVFLNRVAELLTDWSQETAKGKTIEDVFDIVNEFTRRKSENIINIALDVGKMHEMDNATILISKNGIERSIEYSIAPIVEENGKIFGEVVVFRDFSEKRLKQKEIEFLSYHDQLTGLYNRRFYEEELKRLDTKRNLPITIVMGDVNGLKLINDSFGHTVGDELLEKVAQVIQNGCRADDIVARLGGDEFVMILPKTDAFEAEQIIKRIKALLSKEKVGSIDISVSFGFETKRTMEDTINEVLKKTEDHMYRHKLYDSSSMRSQTINLILNTLFEKNNREMLHSKRVGDICEKIAITMGQNEENVKNLKIAGLMHDIGKIGIDEAILNNTHRLSNVEWNEMKRHPEIGYRILSSVNEFSEIADHVLEHHERWDGMGYPKGLMGDEISLEARIIGFADAYDAMTSDRTYRNALSKKEALIEIKRCSGTQFDPDIVRAFVTGVLGAEQSIS